MTPEQLRELASRLTGLADGLDEIRRAVGDTADDPAADLRTAVAYLRECADAQPVGFEFYNRTTGHAVIDYGRYTRLRLLGDGYETIPLYAHPEPQPERLPVNYETLLGAVARGRCHKENAHKETDVTLAAAIATEVMELLLHSQPEHQPASEQADGWPTGLLSRVKAAAERVQNNHAPRRIPADPTDVDLVLGEVQAMLEGRKSPFWVAGPTEAQITAAAYERAAQQCMLIASGVEHYTQYHEACSDCADAIRTLAAKEPK